METQPGTRHNLILFRSKRHVPSVKRRRDRRLLYSLKDPVHLGQPQQARETSYLIIPGLLRKVALSHSLTGGPVRT